MLELTTKRLKLRLPGRGDTQALVENLNDFDVVRWLSSVPYPYKVSDAEEWIRIVNLNFLDDKPSLQPSIFKDDVLIGGVGLRYGQDNVYELGYWLAKDHWGQGLAAEAARELLRYGREHLAYFEVIAHCLKDNAASERVLKKLGFEEIDETEIYSVALDRLVPCAKLSLP